MIPLKFEEFLNYSVTNIFNPILKMIWKTNKRVLVSSIDMIDFSQLISSELVLEFLKLDFTKYTYKISDEILVPFRNKINNASTVTNEEYSVLGFLALAMLFLYMRGISIADIISRFVKHFSSFFYTSANVTVNIIDLIVDICSFVGDKTYDLLQKNYIVKLITDLVLLFINLFQSFFENSTSASFSALSFIFQNFMKMLKLPFSTIQQFIDDVSLPLASKILILFKYILSCLASMKEYIQTNLKKVTFTGIMYELLTFLIAYYILIPCIKYLLIGDYATEKILELSKQNYKKTKKYY